MVPSENFLKPVAANCQQLVKPMIWNAIRGLMKKLARNHSVQEVLAMPLSEVHQFMAYLEEHNLKQRPMEQGEGRAEVYQPSASMGIVHKFSQLPCDIESRRKRAQLLIDREAFHESIVLIGDDDLLSVELSNCGFDHVTVFEIDQKVVDQIISLTANSPSPPKIICSDVSLLSKDDLPAADYVFIDPPYNLPGVTTFLRAATTMLKSGSSPRIFLMVNPFCMARGNWKKLRSFIDQAGLRLEERLSHFNSYPMSRFNQLLLKIVWAALYHRSLRSRSAQLYFGSDLFEFRRITSQ